MRIAALLSVLDEVELVGHSIEHLRAIGVDHVVVRDLGSTDGTLGVLQQQESSDCHLIEIDSSRPISVDAWAQSEMDLVRTLEADWCIFLDADELWIPASGNLAACAALAQADVLSVRRFNVALGPAGPRISAPILPAHYDDILLYVDPIADFRNEMQRNPDTPWIRGVPMPKLMVRPERIRALTVGQHDVIADEPIVRKTPDEMLIAHLPFTTRERFQRKVDNLRRTFAVHDEYFSGHMAWHWRRWLSLADKGQIEREFERQAVSEQEITRLRESGIIRSAGELFRPDRASDS